MKYFYCKNCKTTSVGITFVAQFKDLSKNLFISPKRMLENENIIKKCLNCKNPLLELEISDEDLIILCEHLNQRWIKNKKNKNRTIQIFLELAKGRIDELEGRGVNNLTNRDIVLYFKLKSTKSILIKMKNHIGREIGNVI